jgi:prolipoprotein diacylglyceryl transferase
MFPVLQIGPAAIQTPGLIILISIWLGLTLTEKLAPRFPVDPNTLYNLAFYGLVSGVIGSRLGYVVQHIDVFLQSPLNLFSFNSGLLDPISGIALGLIAMLIYGNQKKLPLWPTLDALTIAFAIMAIGIGLSHLASGDAFGRATNLPWGIQLWGMKRHPSQIYEILAGFLILSIIWPRKAGTKPNSNMAGGTLLTFLALSSGFRLFLEGFRGDSLILAGNIRTVQVLAWIILAVSLLGLGIINSQKSLNGDQNDRYI